MFVILAALNSRLKRPAPVVPKERAYVPFLFSVAERRW
jgi:hypothetical protein